MQKSRIGWSLVVLLMSLRVAPAVTAQGAAEEAEALQKQAVQFIEQGKYQDALPLIGL
jgi:hypothetical protein